MKMPTGAELALPAQQVEELIRTIVKGLRAFQMYLPNNPIYQRAQQGIHDAFLPIWSSTQQLTLSIVETDLIWEEQVVYHQPVKSESFAWMLYKDGMRLLNLRPGAEADEIVSFLQVATRARLLAADAADDLLTLLWEQEFIYIDYQFAEITVDPGPALDPHAGVVELGSAANPETQAAVREEVARSAPAKELEDFDSTLYFLDEQETRLLKLQVDLEYTRDARKAAFDGLLDTFELQPAAVVRDEILNIFDSLFPNLLNRGEFRVVAALLREFRTIAERVRILDDPLRERLLSFQSRLSDPAILSQLLQSLDETEALPADEDIGQVLGELHAEGLETMITFLPTLKRAGIRRILEASIDRLAAAHLPAVQALLENASSPALAGAAAVCGRLRPHSMVPALERLVSHSDSAVRREAVEALGSIASPGALTALERGLDDPDHSVRLAAVAIVVDKGYRAAIRRLEAVVQGRSRHELERAERRQFFEAYATLGGPDVLPTLAEILEPKKLFRRRRRESSETRTCAAYAVARLQTPAARAVLERIQLDKDLPVRNAAIRALREWRT
jgi:HEAT repeat protein